MNASRWLLLVLLFALVIQSQATVDYLAVNHITKEIYWGDDDHEAGIIGWRTVPDGKFHLEKLYKQKGYTTTSFPFKIELTVAALISAIIALYLLINKKRRKASRFI